MQSSAERMTIIRSGASSQRSVLADGRVTGEMWRDVLEQSRALSVSKNFFAPCSRTDWHSHEGGQLLIVEAGEGFVGTADAVVRMRVGDMVWTPPGMRHWHGGSHERSMLHLAISFGDADWQESVSDELYESARGADRTPSFD